MSTAPQRRYTPAEYLEIERQSVDRHEYYRGEMFAMSGARREYNLITGNLSREISTQLLDRPCESYASDMRVLVNQTGLYTYPDLVVVRGEPEFQDKVFDTLLNPTVIFEVISPSTEAYDRGRKLEHFRSIPSLKEYVVVSTDRMVVDRFTRGESGWVLLSVSGPDQVLELESIGCRVPLPQLYAKVQLPSPESLAAADQAAFLVEKPTARGPVTPG